MTLHQPTTERLLDATLETAWLKHPCSPIDAAAMANAFIATRHAASSEDLVFAHLVAASSSVRLADAADARAHLAEARAGLARSTARSPAFERLLQIIHGVHAALHWLESSLDASRVSFDRALSNANALEPADEHYIRLWRAVALLAAGKPALAFHDLLIGLEYFRLHYPPAHALMAFNVGAALLHAGDWEGAENWIRQALVESGRLDLPAFDGMCRSNLAYCLVNTGRTEEATVQIEMALADHREHLLQFRPGDVMTTVAENLIETGHLEEAVTYVRQALAAATASDYAIGIGTAKWNEGRIAVERGRTGDAIAAWRIALWNLRRHPHLTQFWKSALAVSMLYAGQRDYRRAFRWHRRFHASHRRWQDTTRDVQRAYSQATLKMEAIRVERDVVESERIRLLQAKSELEAVNTELQSRFTEIEAIHDELREQASRDPLTGLLNRRNLLPTLNAMIEICATGRHSVIVAMLDLDRFKQFNDKHGHMAGDRTLAAAGHLLRDFFRDEDRAFRYGGDEFCIFLPRANRVVGQARLEAFAQGLHDSLPRAPDGSASGVSVSFGFACFPEDSIHADELVALADKSLYEAKRRR